MELLISNQQGAVAVGEEFLTFCTQLVNKVWEYLDPKPEGQISVVFIDDEAIRELNRTYRDKDSTTDVLSFPLYDEEEAEHVPALLGEIIISLEQAFRQSRDYGHSLDREVAFLLVHGLLHLCGYDHDEENSGEMRKKEQEVMLFLKMEQV